MKQCLRCNFSNQDDATECSNCGSPLDDTNQTNNFRPQPSFTPQKTNGFAITSMVLGIVSVPLICCCYIGVITGILAIIFGFLARNKLRTSFGAEKGDGMALAGIILGSFAVVAVIILLVISLSAGTTNFNSNFMKDFQKEFEKNMKSNSY